ncbi:probable serine hydrolase isoform X2 [Cylas formicarius]|uniref:probable serine hydrolase isoform X2 n=1 Tax=Cylas formicarius TaxID=197179 RepID=UPI002958C6E3|nr:probable serine hydrolase isoform X2 [Cylas formicarius]
MCVMFPRRCFLSFQNIRRSLCTDKPWQEISVPVPWGQISGKWWGPTNVRPILCIHGWQDNCGTFDRLLPLLQKNVAFLAIDLPGHGCSSHLPLGMYYHFTNYIITIKSIIRHFNWPKISLMGHSLGGITSYTYTMLYPDNVDFVACIDGAKPMTRKRTILHLANEITKFVKNNDYAMTNVEPPSYTIEEIKKKIHAPNKGSVYLEFAHYIMERNIAPSKVNPGKYYFTRDPRLKSGELLTFSQSDLVEFAQNIKCPIFVIKARGGSYYEAKENFYEVLDVLKRSSVDCDFHYIEGTHHAHLNNPNDELAQLFRNFIQKHYYSEDRSIGSLDCIRL